MQDGERYRDGARGARRIATPRASQSPAGTHAGLPARLPTRRGLPSAFYDPGLPERRRPGRRQRALHRLGRLRSVRDGRPRLIATFARRCGPDPSRREVWSGRSKRTRARSRRTLPRRSRRADIVSFHSRGETDVRARRAGVPDDRPLRIETRGGGRRPADSRTAAAKPASPPNRWRSRDTTGAGDTFLGGFLAAHLAGEKFASERRGQERNQRARGLCSSARVAPSRRDERIHETCRKSAWYIGCTRG